MKPTRTDSVASAPAGTVSPPDAFPLTDMQEAYCVGRFWEAGSAARVYVEFDVADVRPTALEDAWNEVVAETGMLRAVILPDGRQAVRPRVPRYRVPVTDLRAAGPDDRDAALERLRERCHETPLDPYDGPLFVMAVALLPGDRARVHLALDELVVDGPSVSLLLHRWYALYRGGPAGPPPALGFRDYVQAVRARENPARTEAALTYWRDKLSGVRMRPSPHAGGAGPGATGPGGVRGTAGTARRRLTLRLPADRWRRVTGHAATLRVTPSALLLTLYGSLLHRLLPPEDAAGPVPLVITTYNRLPVHPDVPRVVGPFVSTSVFLAPPPVSSLAVLSGAVRDQLWADLEHGTVSGVRALRERAARDGDGPGAPPYVFTSMLGTLGNGLGAAGTGAGDDAWAAAARTEAGRTRTPGVWLECIAHERAGELHLVLDHDEEALGPDLADRLRSAWSTALDTLADLAPDEAAGLPDPAVLFEPGPAPDTRAAAETAEVRGVAEAQGAAEAQEAAEAAEALTKLPLTAMQTAYLVGRMTTPGVAGETRVHQEFRLTSPDLRRLGDAWRLLVRRHPALRARIGEDGTLSVDAAPADPAAPRIPHHDLTHLSPAEAERTEGERRDRLAATSLPLAEGPPWRLETSALPDGSVVLHVLFDALVADARAVATLFHQLFRLHAGEPPERVLPSAPPAFGPFLRARDQARQGPAADAARAEWDEVLSRVPDGPGPARRAVAPASAGSEHRRLDIPGWRALRARAEEWGVSPDVVLLTVYCDVWRRACAPGEPFTVVVVSWDRPENPPDAGELVTDFTRLSWLVVDDSLPADFGARVREVDARLRADLERSAVADGLAAARARTRPDAAPPFPVVFTRLPAERPDGTPAVELRHSQSRTSGVAVDHVPMFVGDTLVCQWDAREGVLPDGLLDALFSDYAAVVRELTGADTRPARDAAPAPAEAAEQSTLRGRERDFHPDLTLADRLERALTAHADRIAVRFEDEELTYRELGARSARLARFLRTSGAGPGTRVAVRMDRSATLVTTLLAVVRAGAAYVPLDPAHPPARTRLLAEDCEPVLVLTDERCRDGLEAITAEVVTVDPSGAAYRHLDDGPLESGATPADPAYMIYTSGTTGRPKGCPNSHRAVSNRLNWAQETFRLRPGDRVAQKTPYGFDVSVWEFFWPLLAGAAVVVARPDEHRSPAHLARWFRESGVTVAHFVPSMLALFLTEPEAARAASLRLVLASGEALPAATAHGFRRVLPGAELHNLYGPTEAAIDVTHWAVPPGWSGTDVPLGWPIDNTVIRLLDDRLRPVASGEPGEICVGGPAVGLGYHRRPEEQARRFVPSPFPEGEGARLYRTGDLGRVGPDGLLRYLGRQDDQFKIRGLRVEAGEIEAALLAVPGIAQARVLPRRGPGGDVQLAAVCVAGDAGPVPVARVRAELARALPAPLLPSRTVFTDALPLTPNGKLDRAAAGRLLDAPERTDAAPAPSDRPGPAVPCAPDAEAVASLAASLLDGTAVAPDDDLFALGATSFTMIRLAREIERRHGTRVPVDLLVTRPTARGIAEGLAPASAGGSDADADDDVCVGERGGPAGRQDAADVRIAFDPEAKAAFKAERRSLRRFPEARSRVALDLPSDDATVVGCGGSVREFDPAPLSFRGLSLLVRSFTQPGPGKGTRRPYPSAGGFYPVQVYVYVKPGRVAGLGPGVYYLDPAERALVPVTEGAVLDEGSQVRYNRPLFTGAAFGLFLVSTPRAIEPAYGRALGTRYTAVEAGHMCQAAMERATALGLGLCPIGDMDFTAVREHFALDDGQDLVVSLWGGTPADAPDATQPAATQPAATQPAATQPAAAWPAAAGPAPATPATTPAVGSPAAVPAPALSASSAGPAPSEVPRGAVAVIGFAGLLPGADPADSIAGLGRLLAEGGTAIGPPPPGRTPSPAPHAPRGGATVGAYLPDVSAREPDEWGIPPQEAAAVDPQEHLLLAVVRDCLENAGTRPEALSAAGPVGVFTGAMWHDHARRGGGNGTAPRAVPTMTGLAHRISHAFDFHGASLVVDAGCASGLAAVEAALRSLRDGQCTAAVAAAVNLVLDGAHLEFLAETGLLAASADSRPLSGRSDGWILGEGVGAVLLKPLERALANGDPVHAVLRGGSCRHAGTTRAYGMPSPLRQEETVRAALDDAGVTADDIGYVESSATGAAVADALELEVLGRVLGDRPQPVPVGSVKGVLGHMEAASAFGQLAKVLAQFRQDRLLPTPLPSDASPPDGDGRVRVVEDVEPWPAQRRVLLNSFAGTGGYASVVVEAPPERARGPVPAGPVTLPLSADSPAALAAYADRLADHLEREAPPLHSVAAALRGGRRDRRCRAAVVVTGDGAVPALRTLAGRASHQDGGLVVTGDGVPPDREPELPPGWLDGADAPWPPATDAVPRAALPPTPVDSAPVDSAPVDCAPVTPPRQETPAPPDTTTAPGPTPPDTATAPAPPPQLPASGGPLPRLTAIVARETGLPPDRLTGGTDLLALGVDSLRLVRIVHAISAAGGRAPSLTELYERPVLGALAAAAFPPVASRSVPQDAFALSEDEIDALDESVLDALLARHTASLRPAEET
ncbi:hypothetical protein GCM10022384_02660 [Streptomyces marokkonensis]|uniref:Amino acid adenylation domain-containing protein n=1 Tax=Streptomyces marokkonensis TaxID=324855 RepID=A0ABP7NRF7_9ACTN